MRLHTKLFLLLLVISVVPLVLLSLRGQRATQHLGMALADRDRSAVLSEVETGLQQSIVYASDILSSQQLQVEMAVRLQAAEALRCLAQAPPEGDAPLYTTADFNSPATWPPGTELALDHVVTSADRKQEAMPVSRLHQAFYVAPGADPTALAGEMRRLTCLDPVYRRLGDTNQGLFYWQFVSLQDGLHSVFPGHGHYPEGFDPRQRVWYSEAARDGGPIWAAPRLDASTHRLLLTVAMSMNGEDHSLIGVTGIDIDILSRLTTIQSRFQIGGGTASYIVRLATANGEPYTGTNPGPPSLRVIAASTFSASGISWDATLEEPPLETGTQDGIAAMAADLVAGHAGLRHMSYNGKESIWVYGPLAQLNAALLYIVPAENIAAVAKSAEVPVEGATTEQIRLAGIASIAVIAVVAVLALFAARSVTRPLRELAQVARGLAQGRLDTRARIESHDEVGELAAAFNAMVPELRSHIQVKEGLALAHEVQQKLLPAAAPNLRGYEIAGLSRYSEDVGGDYYDFLELADDTGHGRVGIIVGDVAGHGVVAALTMTSVRALLRSYAGAGRHLLPVMRAVNRHLTADAAGGRFVTLVYLVLEPVTDRRTLRWISAGHGPLLFYNAVTYRFEELTFYDIPLGVQDDWAFHETERSDWPAAGVLVIGTDGIWEAKGESGRAFGREGLEGVVRATAHLTAAEICNAVDERLREFCGGIPQKDDVTLVIVKFV